MRDLNEEFGDYKKRIESLEVELVRVRADNERLCHERDQYDARRRESIAKYEELRTDYQNLKQEVDAFKALIGYEKGDGEERWKVARARAMEHARKRGKL